MTMPTPTLEDLIEAFRSKLQNGVADFAIGEAIGAVLDALQPVVAETALNFMRSAAVWLPVEQQPAIAEKYAARIIAELKGDAAK